MIDLDFETQQWRVLRINGFDCLGIDCHVSSLGSREDPELAKAALNAWSVEALE